MQSHRPDGRSLSARSAFLLLLFLVGPGVPLRALSCPQNVWAYYPYYQQATGFNSSTILYDHLSAVVHFSILPYPDGMLDVPGTFLEPALISRAHAAGVKVLLDCGGQGSGGAYVAMASSPVTRATFVDQIALFMSTHGYDGLDVDWETPGTAADTSNLNALVQDLRLKFNSMPSPAPSWVISVDVPSGAYFGQWFDVATLAQHADYLNIMFYGLYGSWFTHSGHNAPLFLSTLAPLTDAGQDGKDAINYYESRGVPASQLQYGLSCFGFGFPAASSTIFASCGGACNTTGPIYYDQIPSYLTSGWTYNFDASAASPYLTKPGQGVISYDDANSIGIKAGYVLHTRGLAGVFIWDIAQDWLGGTDPAQQPLLNAMWQAAQCPSASPTITPTFTLSPTATPSPSISPTFSVSPTFSASPTISATFTITVSPSVPIATAVPEVRKATAMFVNNPWRSGSAVLDIGLFVEESSVECKIYSGANNCVWRETFAPAGGLRPGWTRLTLDDLKLSNGLYFVTVRTSKSVANTKLVVLK